MSDNAPPRKKRFLSSARRKFTSLLRRHGSSPSKAEDDCHEGEDEELDGDGGGLSDEEDDTVVLPPTPTSNVTMGCDTSGTDTDSVKKLRRQGIVVPYDVVSKALSSARSNMLRQDSISPQSSGAALGVNSMSGDPDAGASRSNNDHHLMSDTQAPLATGGQYQNNALLHAKRVRQLRPAPLPGMGPRSHWATSLPLHAARQPSHGQQPLTTENSNQQLRSTPVDAQNGFDSVSNAYPVDSMSSLSLKRKRPTNTTLASSSRPRQHTEHRDFNVFTDGILLYPELVLEVAQHLPIKTLINLYSISKGFHNIVDQRIISVILSQGLRKCEVGIRAFPWRCFDYLCQNDPRQALVVSKIVTNTQASAAAGKVVKKRVPTLRYLNFVMHRTKVLQELFAIFAEQGVPLPERCRLPMAKMWFMFDIPDRNRRIAYAHSKVHISDEDLYMMMTFIVRLDMLLVDPTSTEKRDGLRKMLFSDWRGFDGMLHMLKRSGLRTRGHTSCGGRDYTDLLKMWVRMGAFEESNVWTSTSDLDKTRIKKIFGVPIEEAGTVSKENYGTTNRRPGPHVSYLMRPDQLVQYELVHRGLTSGGAHLIESLLFGFTGPDGVGATELQRVPRQIAGLEEEEYELGDEIGGLQALSIEESGDPLLDLGKAAYDGASKSRRAPSSRVAVKLMQNQKEFRDGIMAAWRAEAGLA